MLKNNTEAYRKLYNSAQKINVKDHSLLFHGTLNEKYTQISNKSSTFKCLVSSFSRQNFKNENCNRNSIALQISQIGIQKGKYKSAKKLQKMLQTKQSTYSHKKQVYYEQFSTQKSENQKTKKVSAKSNYLITANPTTYFQAPKPTSKNQTISSYLSIQRNFQERFFKSLKDNDLFFCPSCYRYVFALQNSRHRPICKDKVSPKNLTDQQKFEIGIEKIQLIQNLSQYVKIKKNQVISIISCLQNYQIAKITQYKSLLEKIQQMKSDKKCSFLGIDDMQLAIVIIFQQFIEVISCPNIKKKWSFRFEC